MSQQCHACRRTVAEEAQFCPHCGAACAARSEPAGGRSKNEAPTTLAPGAIIDGRYRVERKIGRGGMGVVWEATHLELDSPRALKVLLATDLGEEEALQRFKREAKIASEFFHPSAVRIYDYFVVPGGHPCLVMELVEGRSVLQVLHEEGPLAPTRAVAVGVQLTDLLDRAHAQSLVHRDISANNIFLVSGDDGGERIKLLDFGIAKMVGSDASSKANLTQPGMVVGSPAYMSPEHCRGEPVDGRSDLYSVGIVLYEVLTGRPPFEGDNAMEILLKHVREDPPRLPVRVPPDLASIVYRALEKQPADRYQSAAEFGAALRDFEIGDATAELDAREPTLTRPSPAARSVRAAVLMPISGAPEVVVRDRVRIGRAPDNDVTVTGPGADRVSWEHVELRLEDGKLRAVDLDSTNGTFVDGEQIQDSVVPHGSVLRLAVFGPAYKVSLQGADAEDERGVWSTTMRRLRSLVSEAGLLDRARDRIGSWW